MHIYYFKLWIIKIVFVDWPSRRALEVVFTDQKETIALNLLTILAAIYPWWLQRSEVVWEVTSKPIPKSWACMFIQGWKLVSLWCKKMQLTASTLKWSLGDCNCMLHKSIPVHLWSACREDSLSTSLQSPLLHLNTSQSVPPLRGLLWWGGGTHHWTTRMDR